MPLAEPRERRAGGWREGGGNRQVNGGDVREVTGIDQGSEVGRMLDGLLEGALENPQTNRRDRQLERLRSWAGRPAPEAPAGEGRR